MHRGLVALSASAIAAVYTVGLLHTQPAAADFGTQAPVLEVAQASPTVSAPLLLPPATPVLPTATPALPRGATGRRAAVASPAGPAASAATATPAAPSAPAPIAATYKDGTFAGAGTSRFGNVEVAVTILNGRINTVALTRVTTKYPASRIAALPGQVGSRQTAQVDNVSGATASAQAFKAAVQQALGKAAAA
jgi:uncharacterized protein with FMN-binding domain